MLNNAIQTSDDDNDNESTFKYLKSMMEQQPELFFNRNEFGITPLHRCVCKQRYDFVEFIVNALPDTLDACDHVSITCILNIFFLIKKSLLFVCFSIFN